MNIGIIGASGKAGSRILEEAVARGHQVTALIRPTSVFETTGVKVLRKDLFDLTIEDLKNFDAVVDAFAVWGDQAQQHQTSIEHLIKLLKNTNIRLLVVGGAGSLYTDETKTSTLYQSPEFPPSIRPLSESMAQGLNMLKRSEDLNWTYLCPAIEFDVQGERTGHYQISGEVLTFNAEGKSCISMADYALAMVDEIEHPQHPRRRYSVYA